MSPLRGFMTYREQFRGFHPRLSAAAAARPKKSDAARQPRAMVETLTTKMQLGSRACPPWPS